MTDAEKMEFLKLYYNADEDVRDFVLRILKNQERLSELQDLHSQKD